MSLPWVARPRATMVTAITLSIALVAVFGACWVFLPENIRVLFSPLQIGTLILFGLFMVGFMLVVGFSEVRVDHSGVTIRNGLSRRHISMDRIRALRFRDGDPWAYAYLFEGDPSGKERLQMLGIQQTDGARARRLFAELQGLHARGTD